MDKEPIETITATSTATVRSRKERDARRQKRIQNVKTGGDMVMYLGSAGLMMPWMKKSRETQNGIMGLFSTCAGAVISIGLGNIASKIFNKTVDKVADFWDDVKPSGPNKKSTEEEQTHG